MRIEPGALALLTVLAAAALAYRELFFVSSYVPVPDPLSGAEEWLFSPVGNNSPALIYGLTAWMAFRRAPRLRDALGARDRVVIGAVGVVAALALVVWAHYVSTADLATASLALMLVSGGFLLAGREGGRAMLLPAVFMALLTVPLPAVVINRIIYPLQLFTAEATVAVLRPFIQTAASGDLILTSEATFQVIETCSGLRSAQTLMMTAIVYAEVFHRSRRRLVCLLVLAPVVGLFVNLLRVLSLVLSPGSDLVPVHTIQGIVMLVLGILIITALDAGLQRLLPDPPVPLRSSGHQRTPDGKETAGLARWRIALLCGGLLLAASMTFTLERWTPVRSTAGSVHAIPRVVGGWTMEAPALLVDREYLGTTRFTEATFRLYRDEQGEEVEFFVGLNNRTRPFHSLLSRKTETLRPGAWIAQRATTEIPPDGQEVSELLLIDVHGARWLVHHWYDEVASLGVEAARAVLALDRSPLRRSGRARVTRVASPIGPGGLEEARARLFEFTRSVRPLMDDL